MTLRYVLLYLNFQMSLKLSLLHPSRLDLPLWRGVFIDATVSQRLPLVPALGFSLFDAVDDNACVTFSLQSGFAFCSSKKKGVPDGSVPDINAFYHVQTQWDPSTYISFI